MAEDVTRLIDFYKSPLGRISRALVREPEPIEWNFDEETINSPIPSTVEADEPPAGLPH